MLKISLVIAIVVNKVPFVQYVPFLMLPQGAESCEEQDGTNHFHWWLGYGHAFLLRNAKENNARIFL